MSYCDDDDNCSNLIGSFVLGLVFASVITAVLTPYNGAEAREELNEAYKTNIEKAKELKGLSTEKIKTFAQHIKEKFNKILKRFDDLANQGAGVLIEDEIL